MKLRLLVLLLCISFFDSTYAQNASIYFIRSTGLAGSSGKFNIFMDSVMICKINNKKYSKHNIPVGFHKFQVRYSGKKMKKNICTLDIDIENGKTYYFHLEQISKILGNNLYLFEVTENSAKKLMVDLKEDDCK